MAVTGTRLDREKKTIEVQIRLAEQKNRELADIKVRYMERQRQAEPTSGGWM